VQHPNTDISEAEELSKLKFGGAFMTATLKADQVQSNQKELPPHVQRPAGAPVALPGVRVVDFGHFIAGPLGTMMLADLGADVIKIENTAGGDDFRSFPPHIGEHSAPFLWANRNKRSVALQLKSDEGRKIALDLIRQADVVLENFSTGVMQRFGLDYETVASDNPRLIYCSVSAYGRTGPLADRTGFDPIIQAESGFMSLNGFPDQNGVRTGSPVMDIASAMMASNAILAALLARAHTGKGQLVQVVLSDIGTLMLGYYAMSYLASGINPLRFGNEQRVVAPVGVFEASDKRALYIACANDRSYRRLVGEALQRPDLVDDQDFLTNEARLKNRCRLFTVLDDIFRGAARDVWMDRLRAAGVPAAPVRTVEESMNSVELKDRGVLSEIPHPVLGSIPNIQLPFHLSGTPFVNPEAAPSVGQHTREVLSEVLGYSDARIAELVKAGVVLAG
jgi:crotonobetainyl-CoA:carnitine CoA-transferase CaiB-like acyl-CoA transferase